MNLDIKVQTKTMINCRIISILFNLLCSVARHLNVATLLVFSVCSTPSCSSTQVQRMRCQHASLRGNKHSKGNRIGCSTCSFTRCFSEIVVGTSNFNFCGILRFLLIQTHRIKERRPSEHDPERSCHVASPLQVCRHSQGIEASTELCPQSHVVFSRSLLIQRSAHHSASRICHTCGAPSA